MPVRRRPLNGPYVIPQEPVLLKGVSDDINAVIEWELTHGNAEIKGGEIKGDIPD